MSHRLFGKLLTLTALLSYALGVTDISADIIQAETAAEITDTKRSDAAKTEEDQETPVLQSVNGDEAPVGRTLLLLHLLKQKLNKLNQLDYITTTPAPFTGCICVPFYLCNSNGTIITDGTGVIDFRQRRCTGDLEVCCYLRFSTLVPTTQPAIPPTTMTILTQPTTAMTTRPTQPASTQPTTAQPPTRPTTPSRPPSTMSTFTQPTTAPPTTPRPTVPVATSIFPYCTCVPVYQCALYAASGTADVAGIINPRQQYINTCVGAFVCCGYASGVIAGPLPGTTSGTSSFPPFVLPSVPAPTALPTSSPAPPIVLPPIIFGQSCICMLLSGCLLGWIPMSSAANVDPRLILGRQGQSPGTCSSNSMCCRLMQDNASFPFRPSGVPSLVPSLAPSTIPSNALDFGSSVNDIKNPGTANACVCVATNQCAEGNAVTYDHIGAIDPRFGPCASASLVCCRLLNRQRSDTPVAIVVPPATLTCGLRDSTYAATSQPSAGSTFFAEFPWMALLLIRRAGSNDIFQCGGSLINSRTVLTAAHCVVNCDPGTLIVRLGEWNTQSTSEPLPFQEYAVQRILVHPQYYGGALYNDVALVVLQRQVTYAVNVRPVCLAALGQIFATGTTCYASGWGRNEFGINGQYQTILRKVDLPIIDNANCQARLRLTRLGQAFQLHPSFICAGGVASKDTCYKDGGGPLVCQEPITGKFTQAGIISWGIGCGDTTPAVYASVAYARQWIDQQLTLLGIMNA